MLFWIDLPKEKRMRIYIFKSFHESYANKENFIIFGTYIDNIEHFYGITIFNYTLSIHFKLRIDKKQCIITYSWEHKQLSKIGFEKKR